MIFLGCLEEEECEVSFSSLCAAERMEFFFANSTVPGSFDVVWSESSGDELLLVGGP